MKRLRDDREYRWIEVGEGVGMLVIDRVFQLVKPYIEHYFTGKAEESETG